LCVFWVRGWLGDGLYHSLGFRLKRLSHLLQLGQKCLQRLEPVCGPEVLPFRFRGPGANAALLTVGRLGAWWLV